jgi:hypothetical protein
MSQPNGMQAHRNYLTREERKRYIQERHRAIFSENAAMYAALDATGSGLTADD